MEFMQGLAHAGRVSDWEGCRVGVSFGFWGGGVGGLDKLRLVLSG